MRKSSPSGGVFPSHHVGSLDCHPRRTSARVPSVLCYASSLGSSPIGAGALPSAYLSIISLHQAISLRDPKAQVWTHHMFPSPPPAPCGPSLSHSVPVSSVPQSSLCILTVKPSRTWALPSVHWTEDLLLSPRPPFSQETGLRNSGHSGGVFPSIPVGSLDCHPRILPGSPLSFVMVHPWSPLSFVPGPSPLPT